MGNSSALRNLNFDIRWNIQDSPLERANRNVDNYRDSVIGVNRNVVQLGQNTQRAGSQITRVGEQTSRSTNQASRSTQQLGRNITQVGSDANQAARESSDAFEGLNSTMRRVGYAVAGYFGFQAIRTGFETTLELAADLQEETNKFDVVLGKSDAPKVWEEANKWVTEYADNIGRSRVETMQSVGNTADMMVGFGTNRKQALEFAKSVQKVGVDLASMKNLSDDDALDRLRSAMVGNHEAAIGLGAVLNESNLALEMQRMGLKGNFAELDPLTKAQVRFSSIISQNTDSIGDAERSKESYTAQLKNMKGMIKDTVSVAGQRLLPIMTDLIAGVNENEDAIVGLVNNGIDIAVGAFEILGDVIEFAKDHSEVLIPIIGGLAGGFAAFQIIGAVSTALGVIIPLFETVAFVVGAVAGGAVTLGEGLLFLMGPVGWITLGVGLATAAGIALYRNWDTVKVKLDETFTAIGQGAKNMGNWIIDGINKAIGALNGFSFKVPKIIPGIGGEQIGFNIPKIPKFAVGTNMAPKGFAVVGEQKLGPELIQFKGGEKVFTATQTKNILNRNDNNTLNRNINNTTLNRNITNVSNDENNTSNSNSVSLNPRFNFGNIIVNSIEEAKEEMKRIANKQIDDYFSSMAIKEGVSLGT